MYNQTAIAGQDSAPPRKTATIEAAVNLLNDRLDALYQAVEAIDVRTRVARTQRPQAVQEPGNKPSASSPLANVLETAAHRTNDAVQRLNGILQELEL